MKLLVTGATGTAGSEVVQQALHDHRIEAITALTRKPLPVQNPKLRTVIHQNFLDYSGLTGLLKEHDACIWCLGISQLQVNQEEYHIITYDYTMAFANAFLKTNPNATMIFLSGAGADSTEKSRTLFARVKGKTENALKQLGFKRLHIARPAGIKPVRLNPDTSWLNKISSLLFPVLELVAPNYVISATELAKAMIYLAKQGGEKVILENVDLKEIVKIA